MRPGPRRGVHQGEHVLAGQVRADLVGLYIDLPAAEFAKRLVALGVPDAFADGRLEATTSDLAGLIGRPARTFDEFLAAEADAVRQVWSTEVHTFE